MTAEVIGGNSEICVGDFLTVKIRVDITNLKKGEQSGYVHSKQYPYLRRDSWYLIITEETMTGLACCEKIDVEEEFYEKEFKERMVRPGPIKFIVILTNDSYRGLDVIKKHECMVTQQSAFRQEYQYLQEDLDAVEDKTVVEEADKPLELDPEAPLIEHDLHEL